jgi:hypothetical protein
MVCVGVTTLKASAAAMASSSEAKAGTRSFSAILAAWPGERSWTPAKDDLAGGSQVGIDAGVFLAQGADPEHRDFKWR